MLPGFNHNIKYQDRVYHVQTEDSGVRSAQITTLLFIGGNVISSAKTAYGDLLQEADLNQRVVEIMQTQHKAVLRALVSGRYDKQIAERSLNAATLEGPAPINVEAGAQHRASGIVMGHAPSSDPPDDENEAAPRDGARPHTERPKTGKAKGAARSEPQIESLAPFLTTPTGRVNQAPATRQGAPPRAASQSTRDPGTPAPGAPGGARVIEGEQLRNAFAKGEKAADDSIFGNLISPKSLDEVILSYLANNKPSDK